MLISTRGRYAIRVMLDLAAHPHEDYLPMKEIANRQNLSLKYIERIMPLLTKSGLVTGLQGKGGGYRLTRQPETYRIGDILRITEGDLAPVSCLDNTTAPCNRADRCPTLPMWQRYYELTQTSFDSLTLADLLAGRAR